MPDEQPAGGSDELDLEEMLDTLELFGTSSLSDFARKVLGEWEYLFDEFQREVMPRMTQTYVPFAGGGTGLVEGRDFGDAYYSVHTFRLMETLNQMVRGLGALGWGAISVHNGYIGAEVESEATVDSVVAAFAPSIFERLAPPTDATLAQDAQGNEAQDQGLDLEQWEEWATTSGDDDGGGPGTDYSDLDRGDDTTRIVIENEDGSTELVDAVAGDNEGVDEQEPRPLADVAEGMATAPSQDPATTTDPNA